MFGLGSFMAAWAGYSDNSNTAFFSILKQDGANSIWIIVIVTLIAITMNESAVDSLQNAVADTVTAVGLSFKYDIPLSWARVIVVIVNIPIIVVGIQGYNIASIFLIANMMTTCSFFPMVFGMIPFFDDLISEYGALFSNVFSFFMVMVYGYLRTVSDLVPSSRLIFTFAIITGICGYWNVHLLLFDV